MVTVLAGAGLVGISSASASAAALSCPESQKSYYEPNPNAGASLRCTGGPFVAKLRCYKPGYGTYTHYGNRVESGGRSYVWCDVYATAQYVEGLPS